MHHASRLGIAGFLFVMILSIVCAVVSPANACELVEASLQCYTSPTICKDGACVLVSFTIEYEGYYSSIGFEIYRKWSTSTTWTRWHYQPNASPQPYQILDQPPAGGLGGGWLYRINLYCQGDSGGYWEDSVELGPINCPEK